MSSYSPIKRKLQRLSPVTNHVGVKLVSLHKHSIDKSDDPTLFIFVTVLNTVTNMYRYNLISGI